MSLLCALLPSRDTMDVFVIRVSRDFASPWIRVSTKCLEISRGRAISGKTSRRLTPVVTGVKFPPEGIARSYQMDDARREVDLSRVSDTCTKILTMYIVITGREINTSIYLSLSLSLSCLKSPSLDLRLSIFSPFPSHSTTAFDGHQHVSLVCSWHKSGHKLHRMARDLSPWLKQIESI